MATYHYRNKKTGDVIALSRKAKSAYWEEVEPEEEESFEEETFEEETFDEEDPLFDVIPDAEEASEEPVEEAPKKTGRGRGKK